MSPSRNCWAHPWQLQWIAKLQIAGRSNVPVLLKGAQWFRPPKDSREKLRWNNSQSLAVVSGCKTILCCGQMMHYFTRLDQGGFSEISQVPSPLNKHPGQQKHLFNLSTIHAPIWRIQPGSKVAASEQHRNCLWFNGNFRILKWRYCII